VRSLDETAVAAAADELRRARVAAVAICFLNSYINPAHEQRAAEVVRERWPEATVTVSQELLPEFREYERLSSTVVNAYLMPVMSRYLGRFREEVERLGVPVEPVVMSSGGGVFGPALAAERPIDLLLSGPSGGVSGAGYIARRIGRADLVTFDMGGTSTDVSLIAGGKPMLTSARVIDGVPIKSTAVDVHTVGAGGSSIAWLDGGGLLRVGPRSAGAKPGPACWGRGGTEPTVTDANVVLGRLNQTALLAGALPIDARRSAEAIERVVARPKGLEVAEAAAAILAISITNIAQAIRFVSVQRGLDPQDFALVAFGGAGPLHAAAVARELGMTIVVPPSPGVLCAMGVLTKDVSIDLRRTRILRQTTPGAAEHAAEIYAALEKRARETLARSRMAGELVFERGVEARYVGQNFELAVPLGRAADGTVALDSVRHGFDALHRRLYGYDQPAKEIELVTFTVKASMPIADPDLRFAHAGSGARPQPLGARRVSFDTEGGFCECPVFDRGDLRPGDELRGPAILEQMDTTTVLPPDFRLEVDAALNLILTRIEPS
jgi:N-methylhydantoinase A